jgi:hypothetical protein
VGGALAAAAVAALAVAAASERLRLTRLGYPLCAAICLAGALAAEAAGHLWAGFALPGADGVLGAAVALALVPRSLDR